MKLTYRQQALFIVDALYDRSSSAGVSMLCQNLQYQLLFIYLVSEWQQFHGFDCIFNVVCYKS